jgi:glycosyltransferase involved in cell wall biosynthesis
MARSLTIVIASYQRERHLATLLQSIAEALVEPIPAAIEVLVVLDGSTDGSMQLIDALQPQYPAPLCHFWQPNGGLAAARNAGITRVQTELLWLLDDDMVRSDDPDIVHSSWWYDERHQRLAQQGFVRDPHDCSFANTSAPADLLHRHPFDERFRGYGIEDFELAVRLFDAGESIAFEQAAAILHHFSPSRTESLHKLREEGANRVRFVSMHPSLAHVVFRADPGRVEDVLRRVASRLPAGRPLWGLARLTERAAAARPLRRFRARLLGYADLAAIYSGVSAHRRELRQGERLSVRPPI